MRFSPSFLDELRARLPVSEVVGRRVKLKKTGREWAGLSPFNSEKTPSFTVNDQKGFYHDFSSGKHGDIFKFVMETEGLPFAEAVERLALMAGLPVPKASREEEQREQRQKSLFEVMDLAAKYFEQNLASNIGAQARGYLSDRGISAAAELEFRLGYATPNRFGLKEHLGSKGIPVSDMIEAGLLIAGDDIPVPYDRFRDRVMIPIHDQRGRIIGFGGRALSPDTKPKYLNSPETPIFHKGSIVFNFHRARQPAHESGSVIAVEGYMDAIAIHQAGLKGVVATMGTAFTEEQIATLWRLSPEPIICFDSDRAGVAAAYKSIDRILPLLVVGKTFRFVFMREDKDPDDLIREKGVEAFKEVLSGSLPMWDVLWEREIASTDVKTPDHQAAVEQKLYTLIRTIKDPAVYTAYFRTCRMQLANLFWRAGKGTDKRSLGASPSKLVQKEIKISREGRRHGLQKVLVGMLVHYPALLEEKHEGLLKLQLAPKLNEFCDQLYMLLVLEKELSVRLIYERLKPAFYEVLQDLHGEKTSSRPLGHKLFERFPLLRREPTEDFVSTCIDHFIRIIYLHQIDDDIESVKRQAGSEHDDGTAMDQLLNLVRARQNEQLAIEAEGTVLAEEAALITRVWSSDRGTLQVQVAP